MKRMRGSDSPALPVRATSAWGGACGDSAPGGCGRGTPAGRAEARGLRSAPRPRPRALLVRARPAEPCADPGGGAEPGLGVPSRPGGCAGDSAAQARSAGRSGEGARTERGPPRQADGPTDGRPRTRRRTELGAAPVAHTLAREHTQGHTHTHAPSRAHSLPPPCPPARRRPEPALAGKCAPPPRPSAPLCADPGGGGRGSLLGRPRN